MVQVVIRIPDSVKQYGNVCFGSECIIGEYSIIGYPYVESEESFKKTEKTIIGNKCIIGSHVIIHEETAIGDGTMVDDYCRIGSAVKIGNNCKILYGANISDETVVGNNSIITGFCCERAVVGNNARIFGELIHSQREPHLGWDDVIEPSPKIDDNVFIGFGAKVVGGVKIGTKAYITAGAILTKDVPSSYIVVGNNVMIHHKEWRGKLGASDFFTDRDE